MVVSRHKSKGFTLVEMIVVIAIIAILAAVIIPTTAGFIDRARLSNDRTDAYQMTRAIQAYDILNDTEGEEHNLAKIYEIIADFSDEAYNFETRSRDTGFYYIAATKEVLVVRHDEMTSGLLNASAAPFSLFNMTSVSANNRDCSADPSKPRDPSLTIGDILQDELFGPRCRMLLPTGGTNDALASIIIQVTNLPNSASANIADELDQIIANASKSGPISSLLGRNIKSITIIIEVVQEQFNPATTLFVNNAGWHSKFATNEMASINRVVFADNIVNIPPMRQSWHIEMEEELTVPTSVRTIEPGAFTQMQFKDGLVLPSGVKIHQDALTKNQRLSLGIPLSVMTWEVPDITEDVDFFVRVTGGEYVLMEDNIVLNSAQIAQTQVRFGISRLQNRDLVHVAFNRVIDPNFKQFYEVRAYGLNEGLIGIARIGIIYE